jgi:lipoprotein-anchoring transpeptidase ErfK/SrfK
VQLEKQNTMIRVDTKKREVAFIVNGKTDKTFKTVIGTSKTPTPKGVFASRDVFKTNPKIFTGSHMIVTTGFSEVLETFDGGPPRVALHGRGPDSIKDAALGSAASNGCLRLDNKSIKYLAERIEPGTPIVVV